MPFFNAAFCGGIPNFPFNIKKSLRNAENRYIIRMHEKCKECKECVNKYSYKNYIEWNISKIICVYVYVNNARFLIRMQSV